MSTKDGLRKHIETAKMPNGKEFGKCSRIEIYDIIIEAMQFINSQHKELTYIKQNPIKYKIKQLWRSVKNKF